MTDGYSLPEPLALLRDWLASRHVDVSALKSERQALHFVSRLSGERVRWPLPGKSCFPELRRLQNKLCGPGKAGRRQVEGAAPASPVRSADREIWQEVALRYRIGNRP